MSSSELVREFLSTIGKKGGQSRSSRKVREAIKNLAKARRARSRFKSEKSRRMALRAAETRRLKRERAEIDRENWLWDSFWS
jgi:hypothetical protein